MMFPHWTWQWGKSVSPKCRSKNLVATGKHGHVPCDVVNYHTEACSRTRLGVEWPFRHSVVFGPSARFLAVCPTWEGVRGLFGRMVMLFWGIVRVAFLFPRPGSGSPFFGKLSDLQQIIMANHRGTHFGQMSSVFLANCPRTLGGGHFGIEWFLALSARFLAVCPTWGGVRGLFGRMVMLFWRIVRVAFPPSGVRIPFFLENCPTSHLVT